MNELIRPIRVEARPGYHLYLEFADGTNGEVDLSRLVGKGVFRVWNDYRFFENVRLGDHREIKWDDGIELCADSLYLELTHKSPEDLFPELRLETFKELQRRLGLTSAKAAEWQDAIHEARR